MSFAEEYMRHTGLEPLPFQKEVWQAMGEGKSGLITSSTGTGKTLAVWLGFLNQATNKSGLQALWITPLRALAQDTTHALSRPVTWGEFKWQVDSRTGDTPASARAKQLKSPPGALVITPESLSLILSDPKGQQLLSNLTTVIVDEWHELLSSKRGTQVELALARLRKWNSGLQVWGLSATLGDTQVAAQALGVDHIVSGEQNKEIIVRSLVPANFSRFPWSGHLGLQMMPRVADELEQGGSALLFINTRTQAELWFQNLSMMLPELGDSLAIHHGSLDREERTRVEDGLRNGTVTAVVTTSTLDLGVDFNPVDRVYQIGSPKGVARAIQRAGRSGHRPGAASEITIVPTNALELIDIAALRSAVQVRHVEARVPPHLPLDVLVQHLVTLAIGGGFEPSETYQEVKSTYSYKDLSPEEWNWCLLFITQGGASLSAYPDFKKVLYVDGKYVVEDRRIAMRHRMSIGTIISDAMVKVQFLKGGAIGYVEESYAARLKPGSRFIFAGRQLECVRVKDMTCWVKKAKAGKGQIVRWAGARMSLTTELADEILKKLDEAHDGILDQPEMQLAADLLKIQSEWSQIPHRGVLLSESLKSREGYHVFVYPFGGRMVHEGIAALLAYRLGQIQPQTFSLSYNDYGLELFSDAPIPWEEALQQGILEEVEPGKLLTELKGAINASELAKRQFREIARISGLVFNGYPKSSKTMKQLQVSSGLLYDVLSEYEPNHMLLHQAEREVLERELNYSRLMETLRNMSKLECVVTHPERPTPFAFPLIVTRLRESLSSEDLDVRIKKMVEALERASSV